MRTPSGQDCEFYYEDFHRGRSTQECRAATSGESALWNPRDCARCAVPAILLANSSPDLALEVTFKTAFLGFGRKVEVKATCRKHGVAVSNPYTGCPECNEDRPGLALFAEALDDLDD